MEKGNLATGYLAALVAFLTGLTINEFVALGGLMIALGTLLINWVYKHKQFQLEKKRLKMTQSNWRKENVNKEKK